MNIGNDRGEPRSNITKSGGPQKVLPIEIPSITLDELNRLTGNFGSKAFIGEGSYGRVYYAKLSNGTEAAIKKLDTSSSPDPDTDFAAQVKIQEFDIVIALALGVIEFHNVTMDDAVINCFKTQA